MTGEEYLNLDGVGSGVKSASVIILVICLLFFSKENLSAQRKYDLGLAGGTSYYMGDLNSNVHMKNHNLAWGPIVRYNINPHNSLRFHAFYHRLNGSDPDYQVNIFDVPGAEFDAKFVDLGLNFEFNWKPYKTANRKTTASPYVFLGIGYGVKLFGTPAVKSHLTMPFGFGYKVNVGRWLSAGAEFGPRKTFTDLVDGVTNPVADDIVAPFGNRDWYIFTQVFVTYKIFKFWESCPTYDN